MKSIKFIILIAFLFAGTIACKKENKKFGEGSFSTKSAIIIGNWRLYETIEADGLVYTLPANEILKLKFEANGIMTEIHDYYNTYDSSFYKWELIENDTKLKIIDESTQDSSELSIAKLTDKELWFIDNSDGYQVHYEKQE